MKFSFEPHNVEKAATTFNALAQQEAESYLQSKGIISCAARMEPFVASLNDEEKSRYIFIHEQMKSLEQGLQKVSAVSRLRSISQLNGKTIPGQERMDDVYRVPPFHSRFEHSELIAAYIQFVGARLAITPHELKPVVAAAWMHDTGHSAFSHLGDDLLVERGRPAHEDRSVAHLEDSDIQELFMHEKVERGDVEGYIRETRGALGALQSICDTLSYLTFDTAMAGRHESLKDEGRGLLMDIEGIDTDKNTLIVKTPHLWQEFIELRATMYHDVYFHPVNKRADEAMRQLLRIALNRRLITLDDIEHGTDIDLRMTLQSLVQHDPGAQKFSGRASEGQPLEEYRDLFSMSCGFNASGWQRQEFDTKEQALRALGMLSPQVIASSFMTQPFDYTRKTIKLCEKKGDQLYEHTICAKETTLRDEDTKYVIYFSQS